ncbi:hypothetical protein [Salinarchaeum laminariae]|uniref:hypothetical protein n=1 Tax=Salinarchaeum laminariae TaxID=869888 RepID=UPI0020C0C3BE|nr:hypothetical protein [Salinarchaeum laminariae]
MSGRTSAGDDGTDESESTADRTLQRRDLVTTIGGIAGISVLAGCSSGSDGDGSRDDAGGDGSDGDATNDDAADGETASSDGSGSDDGGSGTTGDTGDEAGVQTANTVEVLSTAGTVGADGESIGEVRLTVSPATGASVDLTELTVQFLVTDTLAYLVHTTVAAGGETAFETEAITAADTSNDVMSEDGDQYDIVIPLGANVSGDGDNSGLAPLVAGESAELTITTSTGSETIVTVQVPNSLEEYSSGATVTF